MTPTISQYTEDIMKLNPQDPKYYNSIREILVSFGVAVMVDSSVRKEIDTYLDTIGN